MKKFFLQTFILIVVIFGALYFFSTSRPAPFSGVTSVTPGAATKVLRVGNMRLNVEVADTADERRLGLGGRDKLASDSGMLFIFESEGTPIFWMKGMRIPLDLIWIRGSKVVNLTKNAMPPPADIRDKNVTCSEITCYTTSEPINKLLEVNAGFVDANGIRIGDIVEEE